MQRGSPRRIALGIAGLFLALALGAASNEQFAAAGGLLLGAVAAATWGMLRARPTRAPRVQDEMLVHPVRWAVVYLVTIGAAMFYLTYDDIFHRRLPIALATSLLFAAFVFAVRWLIVRWSRPE
jgi:hypothetical protein